MVLHTDHIKLPSNETAGKGVPCTIKISYSWLARQTEMEEETKKHCIKGFYIKGDYK
jgi:hypothetical protein